MRHSDNKGFFFPAAFPEPSMCCEEGWWMIGSSVGALEELRRLEGLLDGAPPALRTSHEKMARLFQASVDAGLPLILDS